MKCSDCAFWQTDGCKTNPDEVDFNNAQDFACFSHTVERIPKASIEKQSADDAVWPQRSVLQSGGWLIIIGILGALGGWILTFIWSGSSHSSFYTSLVIQAICGILVLIGWILVAFNRKGRLPTLTKIAVWLVIAASMVGMIMIVVLAGAGALLFSPFLFLCMPIASAILLTFKERWAWEVAMAAFALQLILIPTLWDFFMHEEIIYAICPVTIVPLILVILDRKKYWKMVEKTKVPLDEPAE